MVSFQVVDGLRAGSVSRPRSVEVEAGLKVPSYQDHMNAYHDSRRSSSRYGSVARGNPC